MKGLVLGTRNRQSKFSGLDVTNLIGGWRTMFNKEDETQIDGYQINVVTAIKLGSKQNFRTNFVTVTVDEFNAIYRMLQVTEADLQLNEESAYTKLVNAEGKPAPRKQSLLDGLQLGDYKFNSKEGVQIRVYSDIFMGVENAMYESTKHGYTMIKNEAATRKGIRCVSSNQGNIKPIYVENRAFWTTQKDKNGKLVSDTTIVEALKMLNETDVNGEVWSYDKDQYINPVELLAFYADNDIVATQLQEKVDSGKVFTEVEAAETQGFDYFEFDVKTLTDLASCKAFALEHEPTLGTISFGNTKDIAKLQEKIKKAIKLHLM